MRRRSRRKLRRLLKFSAFGLVVVVGAFGLGGAIAFLALQLDRPYDDRPFDEVVWKEQHGIPEPDNPRGLMADAAARRVLTQKMTRDEVMKLLGEPDSRSEPDKQRQDSLSYNLGMWDGMRLDYDSLDIRFDASGRVGSVHIVHH